MKHLLSIVLFLTYSVLSQAQDANSENTTDSTSNQKKHFPIIEVAIPTVMITYGILSLESPAMQNLDYSTRNELTEDNSFWYQGWDNYFQFSPAVAAFTMKLCNVKSTHKMSDMLIIYALSNTLESGAIYTAKYFTPRRRPDNSNGWSFPSGHTATAFVAAEFLHQEYKDQSIWISVGGYTMASLIGVSRIYNNKHWVSDVLGGAGIGILSTKIVYWYYPSLQKAFCKKDKKLQTIIVPSYNDGNLGVTFAHFF